MDRDFLLGVMAVQLGFAGAQQVMAAAGAFLADRSRSLADRLVADGTLTPERRAMLDGLVAEALRAHGGDPRRTLHSLGGERALYASFGGSLVVDAKGDVAAAGAAAAPAPDDSAQVTSEEPSRYAYRGGAAESAEIARGGMGRILVALDRHVGREIALKELLPEPMTGTPPSGSRPASAARFLREARVTGRLEHPSIVPVYEVGRRADGSLYYTMRLVRGRSLASAIREAGDLRARLRLLPHMVDLCQAVGYAHSRGVVHRDLKPENVMLGEFGETVVLDWGLAKARDQADLQRGELARDLAALQEAKAGQTVDGAAIGTPAYMSPEQADGKIEEIDERSDVWSLGAVLYEVLTGRPPFAGFTPFEIIGRVLKDPVTPPRSLDAQIPRELAAVATKALTRDKAARYQTAKEVAAEVEAFLTGGRVRAYQYSSWELLRGFVARHKAVTALSCLVLALILASSAVLYRALGRARQESRRARASYAYALAEKAATLNRAGEHLRAGVYAAKALQLSPYNPLAADRFSGADLLHGPQADAAIAIMQSSYYDAVVRSQFSAAGTLDGAAPINDLSLARDGRRLATACADGTVEIWDLDRRERHVLGGHAGAVSAVDWSPDGSRLASGGVDGTVRLWGADGAPLDAGSPRASEVMGVGFSPDGAELASLHADGRLVVGPASGAEPQRRRELGTAIVVNGALAFSPDGTRLAVPTPAALLVLDATTLATVATLVGNGAPLRAAFSRDGALLAVAGSLSDTRVWRTTDFTPLTQLTGEGADQWDVALLAGGTRALVADDGFVRLWDVQAGRAIGRMDTTTSYVRYIALSADESLLALALESGQVSLWRFRAMPIAVTLHGHEGPIMAPLLTRDGRLLVSGGYDTTVRIWDLAGRRELASLAAPEGRARIWQIALSPDEKTLAFGTFAGEIEVWDLARRERTAVWKASDAQVRGIAWSPDGLTLASAGIEPHIHMWDAQGHPLRQIDAAPSWYLVWSGDGRWLVTAGVDGHVRVHDAATGQLVHDLAGHTSIVSGLAVSPDGTRVVSASKDGTARVWRLADGVCERVFRGHGAWVNRAAISPDGRYVLTASDDTTARIWELATGRELQVIRMAGAATAAAFSADGKQIVTNDDQDLVILPFLPELWRQAPDRLLDEAERAAGMRLDDFALVPLAQAPAPR